MPVNNCSCHIRRRYQMIPAPLDDGCRMGCVVARCLLVMTCLLNAISGLADAQCPRDIHALLAHQQLSDQYSGMGFTVEHIGERDAYSRTERYAPQQQPETRWILLEQDGEQPDAREREQFARHRSSQSHPLLAYLDDRQAQDFSPVEQSPSRRQYLFQPSKLEVGSGGNNTLNVAEFVRGKLTLLDDSQVGCVLTINVSSPEPFSPRTGVRVKTFSLTSRFLLDDTSGLFFPDSSTLVLKGRALLIIGFDVLNRATYYDIRPPQPAR